MTGSDGVHILDLKDGSEQWTGVPDQALGRLREPILVGNRVYAVDTPSDSRKGGLVALDPAGN